ncbi:hypothetical protein [Cetobacterium sp.]|uniref:hypothetical protein n=1 Tax=Cetobacterium sp. TaxID=2071632 RepID=UPI003F330DB3
MKKIFFSLLIWLAFVGCGEKKEEIKQVEKLPFNYENYVAQKTSVKYQSNVRLEIQDEKIPNVEDMKQIFERIKKENSEYKNYFMNFYIENKDISLFRFSQLGDEKVSISNSWELLIFDKDIKIPERYNKISGFIKYSDVDLKIGEPIEQVYSKLGKTIFEDDNRIVYIIFNKIDEFIGNLYIVPENGKVKEILFAPGKMITEEENEKIKNYFLGNKELNVKLFENRSGININLKNLGRKFDIAKRRVGYVGPTLEITAPKNVEVIVYNEDYGFETNIYVRKEKVYKIEVVQTKEKTEDTYNEFDEQIMVAYALAIGHSLSREVYEIMKEAGLSYDRFMSDKKYTGEFESGYLKYRYINDGEFNIFQIENIN